MSGPPPDYDGNPEEYLALLQTIATFVDQGDDIREPRPIDFWIMFRRESDALAFIRTFDVDGFEFAELKEDNECGSIDVRAVAFAPLHPHVIARLETSARKAARPFGGNLDGWGAFRACDQDQS